MLSSLGLKFFKSLMRKNAMKRSWILSEWPYEEGKRKNTLLLFLFTSPSLPRSHPNRKPFRTPAWIKRFNIKINKNWISIWPKLYPPVGGHSIQWQSWQSPPGPRSQMWWCWHPWFQASEFLPSPGWQEGSYTEESVAGREERVV